MSFTNISVIKLEGLIKFDRTVRVDLRRKPVLPREAHTVSSSENPPQTIVPVAYETTI